MFLCYVDETGTRDPRLTIPQKDGSTKPGDWLYVVTAVCIFEQRWHSLEKPINRHKLGLVEQINRERGLSLTLADTEIKSNWIRQPKERARHPFLQHLSDSQLKILVDLYLLQLDMVRSRVFAVLVDKRCLPKSLSQADIHVQSWERLLELVERFMRCHNHKHQAIMINDDVSREMNLALAMSHSALLDKGTNQNTWLRHICEMPMFVRSELSVGVQLADLCSYNIYRAFKSGKLEYPYFQRIAPRIWNTHVPVTREKPFSGLSVLHGNESELTPLLRQFEKEQALVQWNQGLE